MAKENNNLKKSQLVIGMAVVGIAVLLTRHHFMGGEIRSTANKLPLLRGSFDAAKTKSDAQWKAILTPEQYHILREEGTEIPFTGSLLHNEQSGTYVSAGCNEPLFRSEDKFDSGTGWPSFTKPIYEQAIVLREDYQLGYKRVEVLDRCGGHLGHVFDDGPEPTGKRYCLNSAALIFLSDKP